MLSAHINFNWKETQATENYQLVKIIFALGIALRNSRTKEPKSYKNKKKRQCSKTIKQKLLPNYGMCGGSARCVVFCLCF